MAANEPINVSINLIGGGDPTRIGEAVEDAIARARGLPVAERCGRCGSNVTHSDMDCIHCRLDALGGQLASVAAHVASAADDGPHIGFGGIGKD